MKTAIVHDWLVTYAGSERVVSELASMYPEAPIYTSIYGEAELKDYFPKERVRTSFLQKLPGAVKNYKALLPLMPTAFESMDLSEYDLIISSSHACSKGVIARPDAVHVCYCHTPIRYVWSHYHEYLNTIASPIKKIIASATIHYVRQWDYIAAQRPSYFIANSTEVQKRITQYYRRGSIVIPPPVSINQMPLGFREDSNYYLALGRLVPYKRTDLAIRACTALGRRLVVAGDGPELKELQKLSGPSVEFVGKVDEVTKEELMAEAKALLFCGEEDFGIVPVEANIFGTPVIGYGKGGIRDTVVDGQNGVLFFQQTPEAVIEAIRDFENRNFDKWTVHRHAQKFSSEQFRSQWNAFMKGILPSAAQGRLE